MEVGKASALDDATLAHTWDLLDFIWRPTELVRAGRGVGPRSSERGRSRLRCGALELRDTRPPHPQAAQPAAQAGGARGPAPGGDDATGKSQALPSAALLPGAGSGRMGRTGSRAGSSSAASATQRAARCQIPDCASPLLAHLRPYNRRTRCVAYAAS